jgi:NADH-quinone oxidoreductase subunit N
MMILVSGHSFLTLYLGLELLSLCLYALVAFDTDSPVAAESAMKYFVLGTLASGMFLYGVSMVYGATGSFNLHIVGAAVAEQGADNLVLVFGLVFLVAGIAFKLGAVPFHMWLPDVYQGAPTSVTLYIAAAPKLAAFVLMVRILMEGLSALQDDWQDMLMILAILSIGLGNLIAIVQTNIKRLLAYSTISHVGFLLLGILVGTPQGYGAALFYAMTYVLMVVGVFGIILLLSRSGFEAENIDDLKGLNDRNPWLAFLMLLLLMSLAGMPVLVGFYAKLVVLQAIIGAGFIGLAIYAVLFTVIGVYYYLRVVKAIYFDKPETAVEPLHIRPDVHLAISTNGLLVLVLGLSPAWLITVCNRVF